MAGFVNPVVVSIDGVKKHVDGISIKVEYAVVILRSVEC